MFIKANNGNYVNIDSICSFGVYSTPYGKKGVAYRVRGYTFNLSHYEFGGEFATKEAANDWMAKMVSHLNAGAVSLPNTYLEYDEDLGKFVLKPCGGEQDMFAEQEEEADGEVTVEVTAIPADTHAPLQVRDPMCNDCCNRDTAACDHCDSCDKWEPKVS